MGLFLRQDEQRSEIQKHVAAELQERLRAATQVETDDHEPTILENQHTTRHAGMAIIVLLAILFVTVIVVAIKLS